MPEPPILFLVAAARRSVVSLVGPQLESLGLTLQEYAVLAAAAEQPGLGQSEVCRRSALDLAAASRAVSALMERRLLRTARSPRDRRKRVLHLTDAGRAEAQQILPRVETIFAEVEAGLPGAERSALAAALRVLALRADGLRSAQARSQRAPAGSS